MANEMKIANGLILDFTPGAAGGSDAFLLMSSIGLVTQLSSIPASRISSGGALTEATSSVLTITGGAASVLTAGLTIQVKLAGAAQSGYLSTTDWNTFNNKQSTTLTDGSIWIGSSGTNIATARAISGDITISNTGVAAIGSGVIVNADVNASAAIAFTKMAAFAGTNLVLATDGSGFVTTIAGLTTTIAGYLTNITSDVQAQFTTTNQRIVGLTTNAIVKTPTAVQNGYAIIWDNGAAEWTLGPVGGGGSITGAGSSTDNAITRWNGTGGTSIQDSGVIIDDTNNITGVATLTLGTAGLHLLDTDASHDLIISVGTNITADRTLTVTTGDADRTITLSGNPTLSDWFDQSVKAAASPVFADVTVSNASGLHILDSDSSHDLILRTTSNLTADRELIFVTGDATRTLTINASGTLYVTGGTDVAVADGGTGLSAITALSILVANSANTFVEVTPGAGKSVRVNAGGTAWEAYTPGSITNAAASNELMKSNGTNAIASGLFSAADGNLALGSVSISGSRTITTLSSDANPDLTISPQGTGRVGINGLVASSSFSVVADTAHSFAVNIQDGSGQRIFSIERTNSECNIEDANMIVTVDAGSSSSTCGLRATRVTATGRDIFTFAGALGDTGHTAGQHVYMVGGSGQAGSAGAGGDVGLVPGAGGSGGGVAGNISMHSATPSYGGGVGVTFIKNAATVPASNPTGGGILYVEAGALKYRGTSGTVTTIAVA